MAPETPGSAFILSARKFDQKVRNQIGTGLGHEQGHIYKRQWPRPFTYQNRAFFLAPPIYPLLWSQYLLSFLNVHWLALRQNISNFNITKKEYSIKIKASVDTRRGEDLEFTTDPNFFELIFNVLTIVQILMLDPRKNLEC